MTHREMEQLAREIGAPFGPMLHDFYLWSEHIWGWIILALLAGFGALRIVIKMLAWRQIRAESLGAWSAWGIARLCAQIGILLFILFAGGGPIFLIAVCHW